MVYVVGHRGAAGLLPENTLKGFRHAILLGVDYVECDVHLTRDGHLVVMHDATVDRTTNGHGAIRDLTLARLRTFDAGDGEQVPTLDEVLETIKGQVRLLCELKGAGTERATVATVRAHALTADVTFTSFLMERLAAVRALGEELQLGAIVADPTDFDLGRAVAVGANSIGVQYRNVCLRIVEAAHHAGLGVRAWNPDTWREQAAMIALGVDGIGSNRPDILLAHLQEQRDTRRP